MRTNFRWLAASMAAAFGVWASCGADESVRSYEGIATRDAGWLRGDLHMHTTYSDGYDDPATVIALAEYLEDETFVEAHPEYRGNGLDFIAITDHNNVDVISDPARTSDRLVLIGGQELSAVSHGNCFGIRTVVERDPDGNGITVEDIQAAVQAVHAQGGVFSFNHPLYEGLPFPWDIREHDAMEVWNSGWALASPTFTVEEMAEWEAAHGPASPMFRRAVQDQGRGASRQALTLYEAFLARGVHVALLGGSDRHTLMPVGFPTTWVRVQTVDEAGVVDGIRKRHTFVSRTPASTQVLLLVEMNGQTWEMGDQIPVPAAGAEVTVTIRVGRGHGGRVQLIAGQRVPTDEALETAPLGSAVLEETVVGDAFEVQTTVAVSPGDWFYPVVLDQLVPEGLSDEQRAMVLEVAADAAASTGGEYSTLVDLALKYVDFDLLIDPLLCDPEAWEEDRPQCMTADKDEMATFYMPDTMDRGLNVVVENEAITDWCMGAVGSAVMFVEQG